MSVHIYPTADALASAAAAHIATAINDANRVLTIGLAGGGTPSAAYRRLAMADVNWANAAMWLGDERWVPHDHEESNTRMARVTLIDPVLGRLVAPDTAFGEPGAAAVDYSRTLEGIFFEGRPDLVLLGVGDDGHTASLFPNTAALHDDSDVYLANWVDDKKTWRLTASMTTLHSAREIVFLVQGEAKADILAQIIDQHRPYPAQQVAAGAENVRWLVDAAAAARLESVPR
jgi:6-phosphogluconolactonase